MWRDQLQNQKQRHQLLQKDQYGPPEGDSTTDPSGEGSKRRQRWIPKRHHLHHHQNCQRAGGHPDDKPPVVIFDWKQNEGWMVGDGLDQQLLIESRSDPDPWREPLGQAAITQMYWGKAGKKQTLSDYYEEVEKDYTTKETMMIRWMCGHMINEGDTAQHIRSDWCEYLYQAFHSQTERTYDHLKGLAHTSFYGACGDMERQRPDAILIYTRMRLRSSASQRQSLMGGRIG